MPSIKRQFGDIGERIAEKYLIGKGYTILERNFLRRWGEIDLVTQKDNTIVFFEIKTRDKGHVSYFPAEASVNRTKRHKLFKVCSTYLQEKKYTINQEWQVDVLTIAIDKITKRAKINHIENVVWEQQY